MKGFSDQRLSALFRYLESCFEDESKTDEFRYRAAERLALSIDGETIRQERFALARQRAEARRVEAACRQLEADNRSRQLALAERGITMEPFEDLPLDPDTRGIYDDLLRR